MFNITIMNLSRSPLRIGVTNIPDDFTPVQVDLDNSAVRRDLQLNAGQWVMTADTTDTANNYVTIDTAETVTGAKKFSAPIQAFSAALEQTVFLAGADVDGNNERLNLDSRGIWESGVGDGSYYGEHGGNPANFQYEFVYGGGVKSVQGPVYAPGGVQTKVQSTAPIDAEFSTVELADGMMVLDDATEKLYVRVNGAWKSTQLT